jgi:hypothetical protein
VSSGRGVSGHGRRAIGGAGGGELLNVRWHLGAYGGR